MVTKFVFNFFNALKFFIVVGFVLTLQSCAYKNSSKFDRLPENVKVLFVPLFQNQSREPLSEVYFTESFKNEVLRSGLAHLANNEINAEATLKGIVKSVKLVSDESIIESKDSAYLPQGTVLPTQVKVIVEVSMSLIKTDTKRVLWSGEFTQFKYYTPPQVTLPVINSANNLYNLNEKRQTLESLSKDMMQLAFDRMINNF